MSGWVTLLMTWFQNTHGETQVSKNHWEKSVLVKGVMSSRKVSVAEGNLVFGGPESKMWKFQHLTERLQPPPASSSLNLGRGTGASRSLCLAGPGKMSTGTSDSWWIQSAPFTMGKEHRHRLWPWLGWHPVTHYALVIWLHVSPEDASVTTQCLAFKISWLTCPLRQAIAWKSNE